MGLQQLTDGAYTEWIGDLAYLYLRHGPMHERLYLLNYLPDEEWDDMMVLVDRLADCIMVPGFALTEPPVAIAIGSPSS